MEPNQIEMNEEQSAIFNKENQTFLELQGVAGLDPFLAYNSASRIQMFTNNLGQWLVIDGGTERFIQTGAERDHGKYTFGVVAPSNIEVITTIDRYPSKTMGDDRIPQNPESIIIYEDSASKEIGMLQLVNYKALHSTFGFRYVPGPAYSKTSSKDRIRKGEVFLQSPTITEAGGYAMGLELNVAHLSVPGTAEDGIIASESAVKKMRYRTIVRRAVEFGPNEFPLNMYGDNKRYAVCPEIGQAVREDGLLMA